MVTTDGAAPTEVADDGGAAVDKAPALKKIVNFLVDRKALELECCRADGALKDEKIEIMYGTKIDGRAVKRMMKQHGINRKELVEAIKIDSSQIKGKTMEWARVQVKDMLLEHMKQVGYFTESIRTWGDMERLWIKAPTEVLAAAMYYCLFAAFDFNPDWDRALADHYMKMVNYSYAMLPPPGTKGCFAKMVNRAKVDIVTLINRKTKKHSRIGFRRQDMKDKSNHEKAKKREKGKAIDSYARIGDREYHDPELLIQKLLNQNKSNQKKYLIHQQQYENNTNTLYQSELMKTPPGTPKDDGGGDGCYE